MQLTSQSSNVLIPPLDTIKEATVNDEETKHNSMSFPTPAEDVASATHHVQPVLGSTKSDNNKDLSSLGKEPSYSTY